MGWRMFSDNDLGLDDRLCCRGSPVLAEQLETEAVKSV